MNLPTDREAEESVVAASLTDAEEARICCDLLTGADFWDQQLGWAFDALREVVNAGSRPTVTVVAHLMAQREQMDSLSGIALLDGAVKRLAFARNSAWWANIVREKAIARRLVQLGTNLAHDVSQPDVDLEQIIASHESKVAQVRNGSRFDAGSVDAAEVGEEVAKRLERFMKNPRAIRGVPTGWQRFDMTIDGLAPQIFMLFGAATSVGKSLICHNLIRQLSGRRDDPLPTLLFSTEMSREAVQWRLTWMEAGMDPQQIRQGGAMTHEEKEALWTAHAAVCAWPIRYPPGGGPTIGRIAAEVRRDKARRGTGVVFVDHIGHVAAPGRDTKEKTTNAAKGLKQITMDEDVCLIATAHVNREGVKSGAWLSLSNFADSSDLEKEADVAVLATPCYFAEGWQPMDDAAARQTIAREGEGYVMFGVGKNRSGVLADIPMKLDWWHEGGRFSVYGR